MIDPKGLHAMCFHGNLVEKWKFKYSDGLQEISIIMIKYYHYYHCLDRLLFWHRNLHVLNLAAGVQEDLDVSSGVQLLHQ